MGAVTYSELTYDRKTVKYEYPGWAIGIGWMMALCSVAFIPIVMIVKIMQAKGSIKQVRQQKWRNVTFLILANSIFLFI